MRKPSLYPSPSYRDPMDQRLVQLIKAAKVGGPGSVNIMGVPLDGAVLGRKGASEGPRAIREAMAGFSNYNVELGVGLTGAKILDLGDVVIDPDDVIETHRRVRAEVFEELREGSLLVVLGGDNSVSLPSIMACSEKFGNVGLIVIDSHFDLRGLIAGKPTSGSSYGLALENKGLDPSRVVEIGIHSFLNSKRYYDKAKKLGIGLVTAQDVRHQGPGRVAAEAYRLASRGTKAVYISIDLDSVDLGQVSGVSAPSAGGISADELFTLIFQITRQKKVLAADLVELAPSLDPTGRSERVAGAALAYLIAGFVARK